MNIEQIIAEEYYNIVKERQKTSKKWPRSFKIDKELDLKTIEKEKENLPPTRVDWASIQKLEEQEKEEDVVMLPPLEIKAGETINDKYKAINRNKKEVDRPYSAYIPPGTDLENANVAVYFHGWEKWRERQNTPFPHDKRLEKLKQTLPDNTVLIVPNLGINPQRSRPTKDFLNTVKNKLGIKNINNIKLYGHSAGGSAMSRYLNKLDDDTLKKAYPTYLDATYGYRATDDVVDRMKKLNLMKNIHFITKKGSRTDKKAKRFSNSGARISRLTGKGSSHSALEVPPSWRQWAKENLYEKIIKEEQEDIGLSLKHPVLKGYKLTDKEYSNLDDIDKLNLLTAEEEASKTIPFPRVRTSNTPSKFSYGDTASPTYFKSPEFYEYEDSMRAIRGEPTKEESERSKKLTDVVDTIGRRVIKDFQDPQSIAMEDWLSLEDLKNLTGFATRSTSVSKEEAWSALQSEYPELFGAPGEPVELTKTFIDYLEKLHGPQDKAHDKELDFREKDIFNRPLPAEVEPPAHTFPVRRGSKLAENIIFKIIKEEYDKLLQEVATPLIKVDIVIKFEKDFSFYGKDSNVLNQIRSIKGITVAKSSDVGVVDVGPTHKMVLLHLKFMPDRPMNQYLTYLQIELKKIKDYNGDRVIATRIKGIPKEVGT